MQQQRFLCQNPLKLAESVASKSAALGADTQFIKWEKRPNTLTNTPLQYAPQNEIGVVCLFAHVAQKAPGG